MAEEIHFSVNTRLTRLLGETYRSSEAAIKELVDNAWDADAQNVWIELPSPLTGECVSVSDDGTGMTEQEIRNEYLNIASDKRTRTGDRTPRLKRKIKGRKGIGKFAGLTIASKMKIETVARKLKCTLILDKIALIENQNDLEIVPLPFEIHSAGEGEIGTKVILSELDTRLNFPTPDRLREILIAEYGREYDFKVFVEGTQLSVQDLKGASRETCATLPEAGNVGLRFIITDGSKSIKSPGIVVKVDGKAVGKPILFGLDDDDEIPTKLAKRVYGEVELSGMEGMVTADWGGIIENSKAYIETAEYIREKVKESLIETHASEMRLQRARLQKKINERLKHLPEYRKEFANQALQRILRRYYNESDDRIEAIVDVALDAMEHDSYWIVLEQIRQSSSGDVGNFAVALEQFGLLELSTMAVQSARRIEFLDLLEKLAENPETLEINMHIAIEASLWLLGRNYSTISSNKTLKSVVDAYCDQKYSGERESKRPDLLLSQDNRDRYILIEFKRPSHAINRDDVAQAEKYRDDLSHRFSTSTTMDIILLGKGRVPGLDANRLAHGITIQSYFGLISQARSELTWLLDNLSS
jgi:hypothetical protein